MGYVFTKPTSSKRICPSGEKCYAAAKCAYIAIRPCTRLRKLQGAADAHIEMAQVQQGPARHASPICKARHCHSLTTCCSHIPSSQTLGQHAPHLQKHVVMQSPISIERRSENDNSPMMPRGLLGLLEDDVCALHEAILPLGYMVVYWACFHRESLSTRTSITSICTSIY